MQHINKDEGDESLTLLAFRKDVDNTIFLKYPKEGRLSSGHAGIRNISSDVCYDNTKHYQVQSKNKAGERYAKKNSRRRYVKYKSARCIF